MGRLVDFASLRIDIHNVLFLREVKREEVGKGGWGA